MPKHSTSRYHRKRVRQPTSFLKGSFRTKSVGTKGTKLILGKLKRNHKMAVQAILKPKKRSK